MGALVFKKDVRKKDESKIRDPKRWRFSPEPTSDMEDRPTIWLVDDAWFVSAQPDPSMKIAEEAVNYLYVQIHGGADGSRRSASILG